MSAQGPHVITELFEKSLCDYTGAPYAVAVDNESNAINLCLMYEKVAGTEITIPNRTYPSIPQEIMLAGAKVKWKMLPDHQKTICGSYRLEPTRIWDSALRFTAGMYIPGALVCVSFTGAFKHLKLGKGGAVLLDDFYAYQWLKRGRNSGRGECSYHVDKFTTIGRNCYMHPSVAALGLQLMAQFYELDGTKKSMPDVCLPYPDLSQFEIFNK